MGERPAKGAGGDAISGDPLPWYLLEDVEAEEARAAEERAAGREAVTVGQLLHRTRLALDRLSEQDVPYAPIGGNVEMPTRPMGDTAIVRHLFCPPDEASAVFDRWLAEHTGTWRRTDGCRLLLGGPLPPLTSQLRLVDARARLSRSALRVPMELELAPWGRWRAVLFLRPRKRWNQVVRRRGQVWFPAGSNLLDGIRTDLERLLEA